MQDQLPSLNELGLQQATIQIVKDDMTTKQKEKANDHICKAKMNQIRDFYSYLQIKNLFTLTSNVFKHKI